MIFPRETIPYFFRKRHVISPTGCWLWTGALLADGYGVWSNKKAHRAAWEIYKGPIPTGLFVCHKCDVRNCVNPDHLFLGTPSDNSRDMHAKGRAGKRKKPMQYRRYGIMDRINEFRK